MISDISPIRNPVLSAIAEATDYTTAIGVRTDTGTTDQLTPLEKLSDQPAVVIEFSEEAMALLAVEPKSASHKESELSVQEQAESSDLPAFSGEAILESQGSSDAGNDPAAKQETPADAMKPRGRDGKPLSDADLQVIAEMRARDAEVRAHEQAHVAAAGGAAGAPVYQYQVGPDGKRYAVGGHVSIDVSEGSTPEQTLAKAERVRSAALAPASPSPQDRAVVYGPCRWPQMLEWS